ncbi:MAG: signal peptide peptidase SppA [Planctomycetota bacterium]|nr:MAG: signal peptide peptidase SppA [Planctomycetota bacterium]
MRFCIIALILVVFAGMSPQAVADDAAADGTVVVTLKGSFPLVAQPSLWSPMQMDMTLHEASELLRRAFRAPERRVVLDLSQGFMPSLAAAEALADTLRRRPDDIKVVCLVEQVGDAAFVVAAQADEVVMAQGGMLFVGGLSLNIDHYRDLLDSVGVRFTAITSGPQKIAPEPLTQSQPSPEALAEYRELLQGLDTQLRQATVRGDFDEDFLRAARARNPQTARAALDLGLVDRLVEPSTFFADQPQPLRHLSEGPDIPDLESFAGIMQLWRQLLQGEPRQRHNQVVAVVHLEGMIVDGDVGLTSGQVSAEALRKLCQRLADDPSVVAVVLRINSGGGSVSAADRMYHSIRKLDEHKPVVALLDSAAASGGYYIAMGARAIVAHQHTITGSIGVFMVLPDLSSMRDKLGVHRTTIRTDPGADLLSTNTLTDAQREALQSVVAEIDQGFQELVGQRRDLDAEAVAALADGRVFTGVQAHALGLVDSVGALPDAVALARAQADIAQPLPLQIHPRNPGLLGLLGMGPQAALPAQVRGLVQSARRQQDQPWFLMWHGVPQLR